MTIERTYFRLEPSGRIVPIAIKPIGEITINGVKMTLNDEMDLYMLAGMIREEKIINSGK